MKIPCLFCLIALAIVSCSSPIGRQEERDTTDTSKVDISRFKQRDIGPQEICFIHTEGKKSRDSTLVHLVIEDYKVNGMMLWLKRGENNRLGLIYGKKAGQIINVTWKYRQGGKIDSLKTEFKLEGNKLAQKAYITNPRNSTKQDGTTYSIIYSKIRCDKLHWPAK